MSQNELIDGGQPREPSSSEQGRANSSEHVPAGHTAVMPYLVVDDLADLIEFAEVVVGARVTDAMADDDGRPRHVSFAMGDRVEFMAGRGPADAPAVTAMLYVYVADCDAAFERARASGAEVITAPADQFYGDRTAAVRDRYGNQWYLARRLAPLTSEEVERRSR